MKQTNQRTERLRTLTGLPQITVVGRLIADPEIRALPSGVMVTNVVLAANERKYNRDTQQYENGDSTVLRGTLWRQYAENVANSLRKGDNVIAVGRLRQKEWEKNGEKRTGVELDIDDIGPSLRFSVVATSSPFDGDRRSSQSTTADDEPGW